MATSRPRTLAILQARTSSRRLPGKVLKPILGNPMILRQIERIERADSLDLLVLATSREQSDDELARICAEAGKQVYRGALEDVLERFYRAAELHLPDYVVRLTGDCPLTDWQVIDRVVESCVAQGVDFASNTLTPTWPDGLDIEVMRYGALETAWRETEALADREHVTTYFYNHPRELKLANIVREGEDLSGLRWTVDRPEDLRFVAEVYQALYPSNPRFVTEDVLELLKRRPELKKINAGFRRNEALEPRPDSETRG